ncbi:MAG TPA: nucleotidyltransferase domain-containing protein [Fervidobacterium sp.]|nr:nucleotidyltransferase domain-containing protein [Fervidobacterium sp.]NLH36495.1 nucleotidyltransferase domain-containing protein [Thermotogaceae bacterium]MBP7303629.1 nucleotidyltransferase domain-containing protein [Fervidobacterium sp.]MBP9518681.1 nucleotidyltransferase domain-containing protein [Fervidobacterium sp.]HOA16892.1 nucleotidyltransferase domain-containing protein [Fervidobacterium sp.]
MRDLKGIEKELEELKVYLSYDLNIIALYIFGSYGTEEQDERSDIDFAVLYDRNVSLEEELELEVKISDIFQRDDIDVINLNKAPINLQHNVIYTGDLIYCSDEVKLADFKEKVFNIYGDYGITLKFFHDDYLKGLSDK